MEPTLTVPVRVSGGRVRRDEATWGHLGIWRWHGNDDAGASFRFVNAEMFPIPAGCTVESLSAALAETVLRHDGLRTVFHRENGRRWQCTEEAGEIALAVYDAEPGQAGDTAWNVGKQMSRTPWTMAEWPLRVSAVRTGAQLCTLVVAFNRLVLDTPGMTLAAEEMLQRASGGQAPTEPAWQPIDEARFERSEEGVALSDKAMLHRRQSLTAAPPSMFDVPLLEPEEPRYQRIEIISPALGRAVRWMHRSWRIAPSGVLLAAASIVLGQYTGHRRIALNVMAGNRLDRHRRELVATLTGEGLFYLDLDDGDLSFSRLARAAYLASGRAQRFGFCDPEAVASLKDELRLARGAYVDVGMYVNDLTLYDYGEEPEPTAEELRVLGERTAVNYAGGMPMNPTGLDIRIHLTVQRDPDMPLLLTGDTRYLSSETMRQFLLGIERVVVGAAGGESDVDTLCRSAGVTPVHRGASWIRCGDGWADVAGSRDLWQQVVPSTAANLAAEEVPDEPGTHRLVGYLVGSESTKLPDLHRRCVLALGERTDVRTPAWYRVLGAPPAQPADPASWRTAPVLLEGDGR